ncbi:PAS domain-containing protein [Tranquillimonas alkanivorans]|uniref:histidine kinase n=1 Tax=Tranquillimonas alkanivorans TaxID=441119 RepID=A0A1I5N2H0_9RHOB|nr:PAS domain-containing protein [Tranquillimonas alkanivorans]SFP15526.1 PAS domain S-box-containing protein [Tranquillimonas alkanivorans]
MTEQKLHNQAGRTVEHSGDNAGTAFPGASGVLFEQAMAQTRMAVTLSDPHDPDHPLVFVNRAFLELTGYDEDEILGRNCRFLQGPGTDPEAVARLGRAVRDNDVVVVELLNYRKNGAAFWNAVHIGPIYHEDGTLRYIFGSQWDVTDVHAARSEERHARLMEREISHRMKNMFAVISSIVNMLGKTSTEPALGRDINERIRALGRAHEATLQLSFQQGRVDPTQMFRELVGPYTSDPRALDLDGGAVQLDSNSVSILALTLHELATNAVKHGALSSKRGRVALSWRMCRADGQDQPLLRLTWTERGGPPLHGDPERLGAGSEITTRMLRAAGGVIRRRWDTAGLTAEIELPLQC